MVLQEKRNLHLNDNTIVGKYLWSRHREHLQNPGLDGLSHLTLTCPHCAGCCGTWTCQVTRVKSFMELEIWETITVMPSFHLLLCQVPSLMVSE